jgi:hypothetical protein
MLRRKRTSKDQCAKTIAMPLWDLAEDKELDHLIESLLAAGKSIVLVCHSPGVLRHVKTPEGKPPVEGKNVTGFTSGEEEEVELTKGVPFLVGDEPMSLGATISRAQGAARCRGLIGRPDRASIQSRMRSSTPRSALNRPDRPLEFFAGFAAHAIPG